MIKRKFILKVGDKLLRCKFIYPVVFVLVWAVELQAQKDTLHIHYFPSGSVSTISYIDEAKLTGKARAYNFKGEVIYEEETRRMSGSAGVNFTHHENGMVHRADFSSHPDGGIQWLSKLTVFNDQGEKISEKKEVHDPLRRSPYVVPGPDSPPGPKKQRETHRKKETEKPTPIPSKKEVVHCAGIHQNYLTVINHTRFKIEVTFIYQNKDTVKVLKSGEKMEGPTYITAEISGLPEKNLTFRYVPKRRRKKVKKVVKSIQNEVYKTTHTIHLFESAFEKRTSK